ncbi:MAG: cysteine desulfurase [Candidatus Poriferisodalaceae bacterium]|jgi:cysteine desulfurase
MNPAHQWGRCLPCLRFQICLACLAYSLHCVTGPSNEPLAYLDCAASTPLRPAVLDAMMPFFTEHYGNPSGGHRLARRSRAAIDDAREFAAEAIGFGPHDIIFTGGGTEADNLAVSGLRGNGVAVCLATEHHAVLHPVEHHVGRVVGVDIHGVVDFDALEAALDDDVTVVSTMLVNNESGVIQPLDKIVERVRELAPHAAIHTDAVQAMTWLDIAELTKGVDALSLSGHKFGAPKGVGLLAVRNGVKLDAQLLGGGQEADRRSGTHDTPSIVGLGEAMRMTVAERAETVVRLAAERNRLVDGIAAQVTGVVETAPREQRVAGIAQLVIDDIVSEALLVLLERGGVMASAASSCASGALDPSHVLAAMGWARDKAQGSLRLSLGWCSTPADVDTALEVVPPAIRQLRGEVI